MLQGEELIAAFLIGFALGTLVRNEQLKKATEQRDRAENMLRNVSKEYAEIAMDCVNAMDPVSYTHLTLPTNSLV